MTTAAIAHQPRLGAKEQLIDREMALATLPRRTVGTHKWAVGGLVIIAGSPGYAGAAALCAMAAGRAGAGIVNVAIPRSLMGALGVHVPEAVTIPLPDGDSIAAGRRSAELIEAKLEKSTALVIGPGLGDDDAANALLSVLFGSRESRGAIGFGLSGQMISADESGAGLLAGSGKPFVVDADGLNWLAAQEEWWQRLDSGRAVLTPHPGELARLTGSSVESLIADPISAAREAATKWRQVVVFKYGYTVVSDGTRTLVADDAPPSLASAGTGDIFSGAIGAFLAQGVEPVAAASLAIFVGARAARRVEQRTGTLGLVAGDLPLAIAEELAELERTAEDDRD